MNKLSLKKTEWYDVYGAIITVTSVSLFCYYWYKGGKIFPTAVPNNVDKDTVKIALDVFTDSFKSLATITIGLLVAVWGFIFSNKEFSKASLRYLMPLVGASLFLIFSFVSYNMLLSKLVDVLYEAETIDLNSDSIQFWQEKQLFFFYIGFITTIISFFLLNKK